MTQVYGDTVDYDQFLPQVTQYVPDVGEFVAVDAIKNACIEFCERTYFWQYSVPAITPAIGQNSYVMQTPADTKVVGILQAYYNDFLLIPKSPDELARIYRMTDWMTLPGYPQYYTRVKKPEIVLVPSPSVVDGDTVSIRVALAPTRDSQEIDSEIYEQWAEVIGWGARARLYSQPKQPYYDKNASMEAQKMFRTGITEAKIQVNKGMTRNSTIVEFQRLV